MGRDFKGVSDLPWVYTFYIWQPTQTLNKPTELNPSPDMILYEYTTIDINTDIGEGTYDIYHLRIDIFAWEICTRPETCYCTCTCHIYITCWPPKRRRDFKTLLLHIQRMH